MEAEAGYGFLFGAAGGVAIIFLLYAITRFRALPEKLTAGDVVYDHEQKTLFSIAHGRRRNTSLQTMQRSCPDPTKANHELGDLLVELANIINLTSNDKGKIDEAFSWARMSLKTFDATSPYLSEARNLLIKEIDSVLQSNSKLHTELSLAYQGIHDQEKQIHDLRIQARIDALTRLPNRAAFDERLRGAIAFMERHGPAFCLLMLDIDKFKNLNDRFGHVNGDHVLRATAARIAAAIRKNDVAFRYGGEEFAVIIAGADIAHSLQVAERLRADVGSHIHMIDGVRVEVTISGGLAECLFGMDEEEIIAVADAALYQAKERGRNRVVVAGGKTGGYLISGEMGRATSAPGPSGKVSREASADRS